jgi:4-aminobutyrate aminotransferase-like enzyme
MRFASPCIDPLLTLLAVSDWSDIMSAFMKVLPAPGLKLATICGCGSGANENAFKLAFIHKVESILRLKRIQFHI